jgi:hypothetical protein
LKDNTTLKSWRATNLVQIPRIDFTPLAEALRTQNITLQEFVTRNASFRRGNGELKYFLRLNRFGRSKIRDLSASTGELIHAAMEEFRSTTEGHSTLTKLDHFNVLFGLLRESPGLWSGDY